MMTFFLQQAAPASGAGYANLIMILLIFGVFYLFMIRPQMKKQKEIKKFREAISVNDKVVTAGGIYGKVREIKDDKVVLEISDNVKVTVDKSSIFSTPQDTQK